MSYAMIGERANRSIMIFILFTGGYWDFKKKCLREI